MICLPRPLSTTDSPQRVSPGSTPITRTRTPTCTERLFDTLAGGCQLRPAGHAVNRRPGCWSDAKRLGERAAPQGTKVRSGAVGARVVVRDDYYLGARWIYRPEVIADRGVKVGAIACGEGDDVVAVREFNCSRMHEHKFLTRVGRNGIVGATRGPNDERRHSFSEQIRGQQAIVVAVLAAIVGTVDHDRFVGRFVREQLCDVDIERPGNLKRHRDRRRALPALDLRQIALRQSGLLGEDGQREAALLADRAKQPGHWVFSAFRRSLMPIDPPNKLYDPRFPVLIRCVI